MQELFHSVRGSVKFHELMSKHTSIGIGGPADVFVEPADIYDLKTIIAIINKNNLPFFVLGNGTNVLFRDNGFRGVVIKMGKGFDKIQSNGSIIDADSGVLMSSLVNLTIEKGLKGMEFAAGIPGSVGGAVMMNSGAFGSSIGEVISSVSAMDYNGDTYRIPRDKLEFGYRSGSLLNQIVLNAVLKLEFDDPVNVKNQVEKNLAHRTKTQPTDMSSAGCIFKNPDKISAGTLIDRANLKGFRIGDAKISEKHANFIVNEGNATADDVLRLIELTREKVKEIVNISLELEINVV